MPTLSQAREQLDFKIKKFGPDAHCNHLVVSEESRAKAIANEPDELGRQRTRIGLQTYSPEAYSEWNATVEYLMERCGCNPILVVDLILLLVQEAREQTDTRDIFFREGVDGIDIAKDSLFKIGGDYEEKLREAKTAYRNRKKRGIGKEA